MSPKGFVLDDDFERRKWQEPELLLKRIGLKKGQIFLDIGCGAGFFAIPAAKIVGNNGRVYGIDSNEEAIGLLKREAIKQGLENLIASVGRGEEKIFSERFADILFFGIVLHDFQDSKKVLKNGKIMLKTDGRLINIDWKKESMEFGPPLHVRFNEQEARKLIEEAGFEVKKIEDIGPYHYLIEAIPKHI